MATVKVKVLMRHPLLEDVVPGEVIELDDKLIKALDTAVDAHPDAVANPTVVRDGDGKPVDLELEKHLAREKARETAAKAKLQK
jgi:hypothetical protein